MITSYLAQVVTNIFYLFAVAIGTRAHSGASAKPHSSPARRCRNLGRCKVRRGERSLLHEQGCASSVSEQGFPSRYVILLQMVICRLRKTSSASTVSFFELFSLGDSAVPSIGKILWPSIESQRGCLPAWMLMMTHRDQPLV